MTFTEEERQKIVNKGNILIDNTLFADFYSMKDVEIGVLMRDIGRYVGAGEVPTYLPEQRIIQMAFNRFTVSHNANARKYLDTCKKNIDNANKRWKKDTKNDT